MRIRELLENLQGNPTILYHSAPVEARNSILHHGLQRHFAVGAKGIWFSSKPSPQSQYFDTWVVDVTGLDLEDDIVQPDDDTDMWYVCWESDVEPSRLRLITHEGLLPPATEEDDKYLNAGMLRSYRISQSRGLAPITQISGLEVVATRWPPRLWTFVFFMDAGQPVGFAKLWEGGRDSTPHEDDRIAVSIIWFRPEYRGRGIGRSFYDFMTSQGVRLKPDVKQSAGGAALWKNRVPAKRLGESIGHDGDRYFAGPNVDDAWEEARNPRSRTTIVYLSPADFLGLAEPGFDPLKAERVQSILMSEKPFSSLPFLGFDEMGKVIGHEGRHRARALVKMGIREIPVRLRSSIVRWGGDLSKLPPQLLPQSRLGKAIPMPNSVLFPQK